MPQYFDHASKHLYEMGQMAKMPKYGNLSGGKPKPAKKTKYSVDPRLKDQILSKLHKDLYVRSRVGERLKELIPKQWKPVTYMDGTRSSSMPLRRNLAPTAMSRGEFYLPQNRPPPIRHAMQPLRDEYLQRTEDRIRYHSELTFFR